MDVPLLIVVLFCIVMSGFFSATETAFSTLNRIRIKMLADNGNKRASRILRITEHYDHFISTVLIGNNIVNILATSLATVLCIRWFGNSSGPTVSTVAMTLIVLILGEVSPKTVAQKYPEAFALATVPIMRAIGILLFPLSFVIGQWQKVLSLIFKKEKDAGITEEELYSIIEEAEEEGDFEKDVGDLLKSAIEFNELEVGDVYTPNVDVTSVDIEAGRACIRESFLSSGYSRLPVYRDRFDNVIGVLCYKDFFGAAEETGIEDLLKPPFFVTKTQKVSDLLKTLQNGQVHMAIVADEYGAVAGIITIEDIVEEIVGEIWDEYDRITEDVTAVGEDEFIVSGKANIEKMFDGIGIEAEADAITVNGWVMEVLGRIPNEGDTFRTDGLSFEVLKMGGRRIEHLRIRKCAPQSEDDEKPAVHQQKGGTRRE